MTLHGPDPAHHEPSAYCDLIQYHLRQLVRWRPVQSKRALGNDDGTAKRNHALVATPCAGTGHRQRAPLGRHSNVGSRYAGLRASSAAHVGEVEQLKVHLPRSHRSQGPVEDDGVQQPATADIACEIRPARRARKLPYHHPK